MSITSESSINLNVYEEQLNEDTTINLSSAELELVPSLNKNIIVLYLQNNKITTLPEDFFKSLPCLMWLDLRDNRLIDIPISVKNHQGLTHLLLQNNCLTTLPNELGTVTSLKVLQLSGNPLMYPSRDIINAGIAKIKKYLNDKFMDQLLSCSQSQSDISEDVSSRGENNQTQDGVSYNSVLDLSRIKESNLCVELNEKDDSDEEFYAKMKGKCPKLDKSRYASLPAYYQTAKYPKPVRLGGQQEQIMKIKQNYLRDMAIKKRKQLLEEREKIIQDKKTLQHLKNWRKDYRHKQIYCTNRDFKMDPTTFPYDTNPEYMTLLNREDIEKDLPDKYRRNLLRRSKISVPRKNKNDVHLAMKIKQLFENLEALDLNRNTMSPRTEQKVLMNEIQQITEIKQKLAELSTANFSTV